jgi:hypothetical protein
VERTRPPPDEEEEFFDHYKNDLKRHGICRSRMLRRRTRVRRSRSSRRTATGMTTSPIALATTRDLLFLVAWIACFNLWCLVYTVTLLFVFRSAICAQSPPTIENLCYRAGAPRPTSCFSWLPSARNCGNTRKTSSLPLQGRGSHEGGAVTVTSRYLREGERRLLLARTKAANPLATAESNKR